MLLVFLLCGFCAFASGHLQQVPLPVYVPPSEEVILNKYFQQEENGLNATNSVNSTEVEKTGTVSDSDWMGLLKKLLKNSYETTTYRYPTAVWTAQNHEKLRENRKNRFAMMPKVFVMKPAAVIKPIMPAEEPAKPLPTRKPKRGKIKWKDSRQKSNKPVGKEDADRFLEQSLFRYLVSSNLIENIGNVSVETFSEVLKNITRQKADKRQFWPYDENKELRIKFRDEVFMKRKSDSPARGRFLKKQLQRRLERMQDYFGRTKEKRVGKPEPPKVTTPSTTVETQTELNATETLTEPMTTEKTQFEELKLSVAETVYYKKRPFPLQTLTVEEEETGVIPGVPHVDYPMYSQPPSTSFKCPKGTGDQPKMMADAQTRCQVFYICTGDGPAAAMLCPNGTMFNENVQVCDWWYNVDC